MIHDGRHSTINPIQDSLRHRALKVAGHARPTSAAVRTEFSTKLLRSEQKQLKQHVPTLSIHRAESLEHHSRKHHWFTFETRIVLLVLLILGIDFTRLHQKRKLNLFSGLVTATLIARPLPFFPMRIPEVGPKMPFFSITGLSKPSAAIESTKLRKLL